MPQPYAPSESHLLAAVAELLPSWMAHLSSLEQLLLFGLAVLAALLVLSQVLRKPVRYWREGRQITRAAKRLGARVLRDVRLPDGIGGETRIDFLVLSGAAILVVSVKRYDGMIYGSARTDEWTQTVNSRSYKFPNPDTYLLQQVGAVRNIVPQVPVRGLHLFTDNADFPWDKPSNVLQPRDLHSDAARPRLKAVPGELCTAWRQIKQAKAR